MKKQTVKLNESKLRDLIKESIKRALNEEDWAAFDDDKWMKRKDWNAPNFRIENKYNDSVEILFRKYNVLLNRLAKCGMDISIYEVRPNQICFNQMLEAIAMAMHIEYKGEDSSDRNEEDWLSITQLALGLLSEINNQCNMFLRTTRQFEIEIQKIIDRDRIKQHS